MVRPLAGSRVWVAGHRGMAGSALVRRLSETGCTLLTADRAMLDLSDGRATREWVTAHRPDLIFLAAARVGGIMANRRYPATFLLDNLQIVANVASAALASDCGELVFLASSAAYPAQAAQPLSEAGLLDGPPDPSHSGYAAAKRAGIELCRQISREHGVAYRAVIPTNLYGPGDDFSKEGSHVVPALIRRFHEAAANQAPSIALWGTGQARRDLLFVDDLADACITIAERSDAALINIGSGHDLSIAELAHAIADLVGYRGDILFDPAKPDGAARRILATDAMDALGWRARTGLQAGLEATYRWYLDHRVEAHHRRRDPGHASAIAED